VPARRPSGSVPVHLNAAGDIDGYGGRLSLLAFSGDQAGGALPRARVRRGVRAARAPRGL